MRPSSKQSGKAQDVLSFLNLYKRFVMGNGEAPYYCALDGKDERHVPIYKYS